MRSKCCWKSQNCPFHMLRRKKADAKSHHTEDHGTVEIDLPDSTNSELRVHDNFLSDPDVSTTDDGCVDPLPKMASAQHPSDNEVSPKSVGSLRIRLNTAYGKKGVVGASRLNERVDDNKENACASPSQQAHSSTSRTTLAHDPEIPMETYQRISGLLGNERRFLTALKNIEPPQDWVPVSACRKAKVKACYKHSPGANFAWVWMALELDHSLVESMALGNELDLWPMWNKVVLSNELLEPQANNYNVRNRWTRALALGLYKTDTLNWLQRYLNHDEGYYLEYIVPLDASHSCYVPPQRGFYRELMESSLMLLPITGGKTLWVSNTKADFPIGLNSWLAKQIIPTVTREIAMSVINGVKQVGDVERGRPWAERIARDSSGLYAEMALVARREHAYNINNLPTAGSLPVPLNARV